MFGRTRLDIEQDSSSREDVPRNTPYSCKLSLNNFDILNILINLIVWTYLNLNFVKRFWYFKCKF